VVIADGDDMFSEQIAQLFRPDWSVQMTTDEVAANRIVVTSKDLAVAVVRQQFLSGSSRSLIGRMRAAFPDAYLITIADERADKIVRMVERAGGRYLLRDEALSAIQCFVDGLRLAGRPQIQPLKQYVQGLSDENGLSPREREILNLAAADWERDLIAETLGISGNTLKTHVRSILEKCDATSLSDLARCIRVRAYARI
jgi:DNA-binding NarL/FixJ family response regulator